MSNESVEVKLVEQRIVLHLDIIEWPRVSFQRGHLRRKEKSIVEVRR